MRRNGQSREDIAITPAADIRLLIVENNALLSDCMAVSLRAHGYVVESAVTAAEGQRAWRTAPYSVVVLDLALPDMHGLEMLRQCREEGLGGSVLILTDLDAVDDRVRGLDCGADDYLVKPFAIQELVARTRALLKRPGTALSCVLTMANVMLDTSARIARVGNVPVDLTRSELVVLEVLLRNQAQVVSKDRLGIVLHDIDAEWSANSVESLMYRLRRKLSAAGAEVSIGMLRGLGYRAR